MSCVGYHYYVMCRISLLCHVYDIIAMFVSCISILWNQQHGILFLLRVVVQFIIMGGSALMCDEYRNITM